MARVMSDPQTLIQQWPVLLDLLALRRANPARYPFLLASTSQAVTGTPHEPDRYDILMAFPQGRLESWPDGLKAIDLDITARDFLSGLDQAWQQQAPPTSSRETDLPFSGGWFVYLGYELAAEIEPVLKLPLARDSAIPTAMAVRIPLAVVNDRYTQTTYLVCEAGYEALLEELRRDIQRIVPPHAVAESFHLSVQEEDPAKFLNGVARVKEYIREGDVFQVNLSRRWQSRTEPGLSADALFRRLAVSNPAPYAGLVSFGKAAIVSSSPERLVRVRQASVETRPIAGTRPRGPDDTTDQHNLEELIGHPKERAEHVMLIDLERNDLGRVCRPGSMEVNELMVLESYAHVHHIVSNVRGKLQPGCTPGEVIRAVFPGGTITGCPKVRCMAIIAELEQAPRGPYTGSMGYLNHNGDMDLNILIRSIVLEQERVCFRAGAGLVADSIAEAELEETRAKAKGMLLSLQGGKAG